MRRIVSQAQFARYIGKHHSTVCNYIRHRILTRRPDRKLDLHQADRELSEYFDRPRRFRDGLDAELMEWRVRNIMLRVEQLRMRSTKLLGELIPRKDHERILREACPRLQDAATGGDLWSILLDEADGDMNVNRTHQRILREIRKAIAAELDACLTEPDEDQAESCRPNPSVAHTY